MRIERVSRYSVINLIIRISTLKELSENDILSKRPARARRI
jgi:hypothetical protein